MHTSHTHLGIQTRSIISSSNKIYHLNSTEFVCRVRKYSVCCEIFQINSTSCASNSVELCDVIETLEFVSSCIIQAQ